MQVLHRTAKSKSDIPGLVDSLKAFKPDAIITFGHTDYFTKDGSGHRSVDHLKDIGSKFSVGCSTAGEISESHVFDSSLVVTGLKFRSPTLGSQQEVLKGLSDSQDCGQRLAKKLLRPDLKGVLVLGPGREINGTDLITGLRSVLPKNVVIAGGLAGDGGEFKRTFTMHQGEVQDSLVVAVAWYGDHFDFNSSSRGGWKPFGPSRKITRAEGTTLYEIDGEKALSVYKTYLKGYADDLPRSGLFFPFALVDKDENETGIIRSILGVDEAAGSLILAGGVLVGQSVRLMHASNDGLIEGAREAAGNTAELSGSGGHDQSLGILISCIGRKLVLGDEVEDEVESVREMLPKHSTVGFYSYGEIGPFLSKDDCLLHNQTMSVISINEKD